MTKQTFVDHFLNHILQCTEDGRSEHDESNRQTIWGNPCYREEGAVHNIHNTLRQVAQIDDEC